jgi:hypothetical protein
MLVKPRIQTSLCFSAGRLRVRSVDSMTLKEDGSRDCVHNDRAAIQEPDKEGSPNNGGRIYNSSVISMSDRKRLSLKLHNTFGRVFLRNRFVRNPVDHILEGSPQELGLDGRPQMHMGASFSQ